MASDDDRSEKSDDSRRKSRKMSDDEKSRSRSRSRSPQRENQERVTKVIDIATDDAAFVLGRGGATKRKIARVSGANIELDEHALTITLNGTELCGNQIYGAFLPESSRRPPRHRFDACSMAWRCRFLTARRSQHGRAIAENDFVIIYRVHPTHG